MFDICICNFTIHLAPFVTLALHMSLRFSHIDFSTQWFAFSKRYFSQSPRCLLSTWNENIFAWGKTNIWIQSFHRLCPAFQQQHYKHGPTVLLFSVWAVCYVHCPSLDSNVGFSPGKNNICICPPKGLCWEVYVPTSQMGLQYNVQKAMLSNTCLKCHLPPPRT